MEKQFVKILMVEDSEDDFLVVRDMLNLIPNYQFTLEWVNSYEEAIAAMQCTLGHSSYLDCHYDACLLDYHLGQCNGVEVLQSAIALGTQLPIILLTGAGDRDIDLQAMESGASAFLSKDEITPASLERTLRYAIRQKQAIVALQMSQQMLAVEKFKLEGQVAERSHELSQTQAELITAKNRAAYLNQLQTRLLSSISHELRTPLTTIQGSAELLKRQPQGDESKRLLRFQRINESVERITRTLDTSLLYAALEAGEIACHPTPIEVIPFCEALAADFQKYLDGQQQLQLLKPEQSLPVTHLDADLVQLMLTHLLFNAIRYAPKSGTIVLEVEVNQTGADAATIVFNSGLD